MGEMAEMILDGLLDEQTGEYIDGEAPGYPRSIYDAHSIDGPKKGVLNWLRKKGGIDASSHNVIPVLNSYREFLELPVIKGNFVNQISLVIQKDFNKFVNWFQQNYSK